MIPGLASLSFNMRWACIEVHHKKPISEMVEGETTKLDDVECLCANCHRIVHRLLKANEQSGDKAVSNI